MTSSPFIHLRVHSAFSLSEGAIKLKNLVALAATHLMPAVAVADTGNLFGALEFALTAAENGVQPIIGCELRIRRSDRAGLSSPYAASDALIVLVQNETGYRNLLQLVSMSYLAPDYTGQAMLDLVALEGASDGLIALTGGPSGALNRLADERNMPAAKTLLDSLIALFPGRLYIELQRHGTKDEQRAEPILLDLAYKHDLPLVATNEVYFETRDLYEAHDVLLCIAGSVTVSAEQRRRLTPEHYFKSTEEMGALFQDLPEAIANTQVIAQRCAFMPEMRKPILPAFPTRPGLSEAQELAEQAETGLERRFAGIFSALDRSQYRDRLAYELEVINTMGFAGYFLIVADFIQWAKSQAIPVGPGRGSGAGSVVAWALTITDLDPIRFGLLFERFLNPERVSMPDFDIDFCQERRDEVINYVQSKYGNDRVAQIITFGKLQARAVLRDVGRVLEMPYSQVDRICKLVPVNPTTPVTLGQAIERDRQLQVWRDSDETVRRLLETGLKLEGLYRHASTHAAGVVIADRPLEQLVPLYRDPRSAMPVTQFNMKYVEQAGLVKFDFLGLKTLTLLANANVLLEKRGITLDLANLPLDDQATYAMLSKGEASGVFQLESSGMRDVLRKLKPDRFEDIIAIVALYRPGPMDNIPSYIARKQGVEKPDYLHPMLEPILAETYGIMIYQEQVMQIAQRLSNYSLGSADLLRRAMGKKNMAEMAAQREAFVAGAGYNGVESASAAMIFDLVEKFAGYGFNKSHAAAYALLSYQTAYLKANHPVEFFAASMTLDMANTDKLSQYRQELARLKIKLLPPDINRSQAQFSVENLTNGDGAKGYGVRYALAAIKNVGATAMTAIVEERDRNGPFKSLEDFAERINPRVINRRQLENLALAGVFDTIVPSRAASFAAADILLARAAEALEERELGQVNLFGSGDKGISALRLPVVSDWSQSEKLAREFSAIGFYLSAHPLDNYASALKRLRVTPVAEMRLSLRDGEIRSVKLAGIVLSKQERTSQRGHRFAFVECSDASGMFELTLFSEILAVSRELLDMGKPLLVTAEVRREGDDLKILAQNIVLLDVVALAVPRAITIKVDNITALPAIQNILAAQNGSINRKSRIDLRLEFSDSAYQGTVDLSLPGPFAVTHDLSEQLSGLIGVTEVLEV